MIDYFALLGEERRPYLDPDHVTQTFRELTRRAHPDQATAVSGAEAGENFTLLTLAQQTLRDPKLRLGHLIALDYPETRLSGPAEVPRELASLFGPIHGLLEQVDALLARKAAAPSALARALLAREEMALRANVEAQLCTLEALFAGTLERLRAFDAEWSSSSPATAESLLVSFYYRFSYLSRWLEQFRERLFQLGA